MIEIVIGILVALATLFLGLSLDVVLGRNNRDRVTQTYLDFDLTGYEVPSDDVDLRVKKPKAHEAEVDIDLFAMEDDSDRS